jgi:hypothetical protein
MLNYKKGGENMATYRVVYQGSGSPASGITGKIFVNGREVHNGNLMHNFEFMI